tara:strand:- start:4729 stop:6378 length:1650 start_codon:yes stop_codon:yes gene_type:complete
LGCISAYAEYEPPLKWSGNIYQIINKQMKVFEDFSEKTCGKNDESTYLSLLKEYRGQGFYLPKFKEHIDRTAILSNMGELRAKVNYVEKITAQFEKDKKLPSIDILFSEINVIVNNLLNLKKRHYQTLDAAKKKKIVKESNRELIKLRAQFDVLMKQLYFLQSFRYPNDFLELRANYEKVKDKESDKLKKQANKIFFYRKIVEDGALNPDRTYPDKYVRSTLDNLYHQIQKERGFISEDVRYDLDWVEKNIKRLFRLGYRKHLARLNEWKERSLENFKFYTEIVQKQNQKKADFLLKKENVATEKLREFVYKKQAEVYTYWAKKSELQKALYVLETILVNEVGVLDGRFGLERTAVAKVVLNRYHDDFYNQLEDDQLILKYLPKDIDHEEELWLNVLFKVGEFSFTYHYIPAVDEIFCPDMSSRGKAIRKKNLKLALKALKEHDGEFKAMRYFSRISMFGKIDMSTVWEDYERLPELLGYESSHQRRLAYYYHANQYEYLYTFEDIKGVEYTVVKIKDRTYSMRWVKGKPVFYDYRNPHLFKYFVKKEL